jgi:hypothetical protein
VILNKRKAAIGYATYVVAGRVARTVVGRRRARRSMRSRMSDAMPRRRTALPLVGGAAAAVAGAAVIARHRRRNGSHDPD